MFGSSHIPSDVLTQTEIEPRPETFAGVSCRERDFSPSISKFGIILNYEQMKQPMENIQLNQNSLKRNVL